jgi:hypothetical protein
LHHDGEGEIKADQVECSRCKTWYSTQTLGIDHWSNSKIRQSYIACRKCVLALRDENSILKKRVLELENIINKANQAGTANLPGPSSPTVNEDELKTKVEEGDGGEAGTTDKANKHDTSQKPKQSSNPKGCGIEIGRKIAHNQQYSSSRTVKPPIIMVGDSMIGSLRGKVSVNEAGSEIVCLSGANIIKIREEVKHKSERSNGGLLVLQGGGNGLREIGVEKTVEEIISTTREAHDKNLAVAVVGILRRPREDGIYEQMRKEVNEKVFQRLVKMKVEYMRKHEERVSYLDPDCMKEHMYRIDGVHLNNEGAEGECAMRE